VKAVTSLKNCFGRDDVIVEFYVRELLSLVLQNAVKGSKKLVNIYDKVECYIRELETLGVTTDKCAAMLYPLVESLPEEVLRSWQRSGQRDTIEAGEQRGCNDRFTRLLKFLQSEMENEERIDMVLTGFSLSTKQDKNRKIRSDRNRRKQPALVFFLYRRSRGRRSAFFASRVTMYRVAIKLRAN